MKKGDLVFYYHSNANPSAIVGVCQVVKEAYPDHTAFDASDDYYDPKSKAEDPTWFMVDLKAVETLARPVSLDEIKRTKALQQMALVKLGRLSVSPVTEQEYETIRAMAGKNQKG
jgi:predicted RNA-binding protein with PUA-like domain